MHETPSLGLLKASNYSESLESSPGICFAVIFTLAGNRAVEWLVIQFLQTSWRCATLHRPPTSPPRRASLWQTAIRHAWQLPVTLKHLPPSQAEPRGILGSMLNTDCERMFILSQASGEVLSAWDGYHFRDRLKTAVFHTKNWGFSQKYTITVKTCIFCDMHWFWDVVHACLDLLETQKLTLSTTDVDISSN